MIANAILASLRFFMHTCRIGACDNRAILIFVQFSLANFSCAKMNNNALAF